MNRLLFLSLSILIFWSCDASEGNLEDGTAQSVSIQEYTKDWNTDTLEVATFAGGNFIGLEVVFEQMRGVEKVVSGYTGGKKRSPSHKAVEAGKTDHVMAIQVYFNPKRVSYDMLLAVYFVSHDPTNKLTQGVEVGKQYSPVIFYHNEVQKDKATKKIASEEKKRKYDGKPIVTEAKAYDKFWAANKKYQDFAKNNVNDTYVQEVVKPFVVEVESGFGAWMIKNKGIFPLNEGLIKANQQQNK